jgi:hypothetical protein
VKRVPFFVLLPLVLAGTLSLTVLGIILIDQWKPEAPFPTCRLEKQGEWDNIAMAAGVDRFGDGTYRLLTLSDQLDQWRNQKLIFKDNNEVNLETVGTVKNNLAQLDSSRYHAIATMNNLSFIGTENGRVFPVEFSENNIVVYNQLGSCGQQFKGDVQIGKLSNNLFAIIESSGRVGIYEKSNWSRLVAREVPKSAEQAVSFEASDAINYLSCRDNVPLQKSRIRLSNEKIFISSADRPEVRVIKVSDYQFFQSESIRLEHVQSFFSDFIVGPDGYVGFKVSNWLDPVEKWSFAKLEESLLLKNFNVQTFAPVSFREKYQVFGETKENGIWIAEKKNRIFFDDEVFLAELNPEEGLLRKRLLNSNAENALLDGGLWIALPGRHHLFISNKEYGKVKYSLMNCGLN